ncbi:MAG TPA: hypothetical protein VI603_07555 [Saprospiraceae bacterium]|nr:hypothetical protein [Saprospiraceae bacterium]
MEKIKYKYWQDGDFWLGYLLDFPDYLTQGTSLDDLKEHLIDLHQDLSHERIENIRKVGELDVS